MQYKKFTQIYNRDLHPYIPLVKSLSQIISPYSSLLSFHFMLIYVSCTATISTVIEIPQIVSEELPYRAHGQRQGGFYKVYTHP